METVAYLLVWALLFMFMMRFGCGAHVMGHRHHGQHGERADGSGRIAEPALATDPVCGMTVTAAGAKSAIFGGKAWYFCSAACRDKFEAAPQQYAKPGLTSPSGEPHHAA